MSESQDEIQRLLDRFLGAWNAADVAGMTACWLDSGDVVSTEGQLVRGRQDIAALLADEWQGALGGSHAAMTLQAIRPLGPGVAVVDADMQIRHEARSANLHMHVVFVAALDEGAWWFLAVRPYVLYTKETGTFAAPPPR